MAIRIITRGKLPPEHEYKTVCKYCNTEIGYTVADTRRYSSDFLLLLCPLCSKDVKIMELELYCPDIPKLDTYA